MSQALESFDDFKTESFTQDSNDSLTNTDAAQVPETELDTFDNLNPKFIESKAPSAKSEAKDPKDSNVELLDDQDDTKEEKKEEPKKEEDKKEVKSEENPEVKEEVKEEKEYKPTGKVIKGLDGDQEVKISANTVLPVKIDGKVQQVPLQEMINKYSGNVAVEKRLAEVDLGRKQFEAEKSQFTKQAESLKSTVNEFYKKLTTSENPNEAIEFLLDTFGQNPAEFYLKLFNSNHELFEKYSMMDETERKLWIAEKNNEFLKKTNESVYGKQKQEQETKNFLGRIHQAREAHGVSEENYIKGYKELVSLGYDAKVITPEAVCDYVTLTPHLVQADELLKPYSDYMDDDKVDELVLDFANGLRSKKYSLEQIKDLLEKEFGSSEAVKELNTKEPIQEKKTNPKYVPSDNPLESFDDIEY